MRVGYHASFALGRGRGCGLGGEAAGGGGDEAQDFDGLEGRARDKEAESVGARVGWGEEETVVVEERVGEGEVEGGEAFEEFVVLEGEAEPDAVAAGAGLEGHAADALGICLVVEVEVANVCNSLEGFEGEGSEAAVRLHEGDLAVAQEAGLGKVSPGEFVGDAAKNDFLLSWSHGGWVRLIESMIVPAGVVW